MFGSWGNGDHDDCDPHHPRARSTPASTSSTRPTSTRRGESEEIVGKALAGPARRRRPRDQVLQPMGDDPNQRGVPRWIMQRGRGLAAPADTDWIDLYQVHRPDPTTDIDETLAALDRPRAPGKVRYIGSRRSRPSQIVEAQWAPRTAAPALRHRAAAVLDPRPRAETTCSRRARGTAWASSRTAR